MAASTDFADRIAAATLDEFESQGVFRVLLESLSHPGTRHRLPTGLAERIPAALIPVVALADVDVEVAVLGGQESGDWEAVVLAATGGGAAPVPEAAMVAALGTISPDVVRILRRGDAHHPELAARLVLTATAILDETPERGEVVLDLRGPGVPDTRRVGVDGIHPEVFDALIAANAEFPSGVDTWIVTASGEILGLPRSITSTVAGHIRTPRSEGG